MSQLADRLLAASNNLEKILLSIRKITAVLSNISDRSLTEEALTSHEKSVLKQIEVHLRREPWSLILSDSLSSETLDDLVSPHVDLSASYSMCDIECDVDELDWDTEGIELSVSSPSITSPLLAVSDSFTSYHSVTSKPLNMESSRYSEADSGTFEEIYFPYCGVYEEEMEMSLEFEEGFYSDNDETSSIKGGFDESHLESKPMRILTKDEEKLAKIDFVNGTTKFKPKTSNYCLVNIDDDQKSVSSNQSPLLKRYAPIENLFEEASKSLHDPIMSLKEQERKQKFGKHPILRKQDSSLTEPNASPSKPQSHKPIAKRRHHNRILWIPKHRNFPYIISARLPIYV